MGKKKSKSKSKAAAAAASRGVVGPDYVQVIAGKIASRSVSLVLCGESHHDAIDVTRASGGIVREGWTATDHVDLSAEMAGKHGVQGVGGEGGGKVRVRCGTCKRNGKLLPLGKAKEWGTGVGSEEIDYIEHGHEMALLWVPSKRDGDGSKGRTYLVELSLDFAEEGEEEEDGKDKLDKSAAHFPPDVVDLLRGMNAAIESMRGAKSLSTAVRDLKDGVANEMSRRTLLLWTDLDAEARELNHRRLLGEEISTAEYDGLINKRKERRRKDENVWTWDDWLVEVKSKLSASSNGKEDSEGSPALHVVLESSIPPWEVELCRDFVPGFQFSQAADCIRCISEDSDGSSVDDFDPAADGFGSYIDYVFRRLLSVQRAADGGATDDHRGFLHCVDCRDLGCEHACVEDSLHGDWMGLLDEREKEGLLGAGDKAAHTHHKNGRCLPDWNRSPEEIELDNLRASGVLKDVESDCPDDERDDDDVDDLITFPSMESFFGQCTDIMYYTPNFKVAYGPFLGKCVKSCDTWNSFFSELFFGGTVEKAMSMLDLSASSNMHVRSPIMKVWNTTSGEYEWHKREDEESDLTLSLFPVKCFLKARGSDPVRTWSSGIFASLLESDCQELKDVAIHARAWALNDIAKHCANPKMSDDEIGGGEWFLAYLRQCHREIYDDIDHSDAAALLQKQSAAGDKKKHKIGKIAVPSCDDGFKLIEDSLEDGKATLSNEAEVMAKIVIDIYMSKLVDAVTVAKILQIISEEESDNIVIVCYMGSVHTRALTDFFTQPKLGFKKKIFCGKQDYDEEEGRVSHLSAELWNLRNLFK